MTSDVFKTKHSSFVREKVFVFFSLLIVIVCTMEFEDGDEFGHETEQPTIRNSYSLPETSVCTALCVLSELLYQRGLDVTRVADKDIDVHRQHECEGLLASGNNVPGTNVAPTPPPLTSASLDMKDNSDFNGARAAPTPRSQDDRTPVCFPPVIQNAREVLRGLGDDGIHARNTRLHGKPIMIAAVPSPTPRYCAADIHGARPGSIALVFSTCHQTKVLVQTARSIVETIESRHKELAKRNTCIYTAVVLHNGDVNQYARAELLQCCSKLNILLSDCSITELQVNVTTHCLVPQHIPVHQDLVLREMAKLGLDGRKVALLCEDDAVVRALGLRPGDHVRVRRHGYPSVSQVVYRRVVSQKLK